MSKFVEVYTFIGDSIGLGSPLTRFLFGTCLGFGLQLILKPSISYHKNGKPKSFITETYAPWYIVSLLPGLIGGLFL